MIEVRDAGLVRGGHALLNLVNLSLSAGELLAVVGPNGAGKTSLLRVLSGEQTPDRGTVLLDDIPLARWPLRRLARRRAVLPQETLLDFPLSALEVVLMGRMPHERSSGDQSIAMQTLAQADALHLAGRLYPTLSGGERQRVQLARVLTQLEPMDPGRPGFLLLDEPTSALDLSHQFSLLRVVRDRVRQGAGALAVLHDLNLAAQFADRIVVMDAGRIVATGTPAEVLDPDLIRRIYDVDSIVIAHPTRLAVPHVIPLPQMHGALSAV